MITRKEKKKFAKNLRNNPTYCEARLMMALKREGISFEFNPILYGFIPDFYFKGSRLVVEVDGSIHGLESVKENDRRKDEAFSYHNVKVMRFSNSQVSNELGTVVKAISDYVGHRKVCKKPKWKKSKNRNRRGKNASHKSVNYGGFANPKDRFCPGENKTLYVPKEETKVKRPLKIRRIVSRASL